MCSFLFPFILIILVWGLCFPIGFRQGGAKHLGRRRFEALFLDFKQRSQAYWGSERQCFFGQLVDWGRVSHLKGCFINSHHGWFQQLEVSISLKVMIFQQGSKKGSKRSIFAPSEGIQKFESVTNSLRGFRFLQMVHTYGSTSQHFQHRPPKLLSPSSQLSPVKLSPAWPWAASTTF